METFLFNRYNKDFLEYEMLEIQDKNLFELHNILEQDIDEIQSYFQKGVFYCKNLDSFGNGVVEFYSAPYGLKIYFYMDNAQLVEVDIQKKYYDSLVKDEHIQFFNDNPNFLKSLVDELYQFKLNDLKTVIEYVGESQNVNKKELDFQTKIDFGIAYYQLDENQDKPKLLNQYINVNNNLQAVVLGLIKIDDKTELFTNVKENNTDVVIFAEITPSNTNISTKVILDVLKLDETNLNHLHEQHQNLIDKARNSVNLLIKDKLLTKNVIKTATKFK